MSVPEDVMRAMSMARSFDDVTVGVPGMEAALRHRPEAAAGRGVRLVSRCGANAWALALGEGHGAGRGLDQQAVEQAARRGPSIGAVMAALNSQLIPGRGRAGLLFAVLELDRCGAWVTIACGDHPLPVLVRRAGWIDVRGQAGPPLGASPDATFGVDRVGLGPGDALVLASPGVTGMRDRNGEAFADEALAAVLLAGADVAAEDLADRVLQAAAAHGGGTLPDDAAVLVIRVPVDAGDHPDTRLRDALGAAADDLPGYPVGEPHWTPNRRPAPPRQARIVLAPQPASVPAGRRFATTVLHSWRLSELAEGGDVELITSELVSNAVRHGRHDVTVLLGYDGRRVRVAVGDGSRALPRSRAAGEGDVDGRGMVIVEALAAAVGVSPTVGGKRVWAEVDVPGVQAGAPSVTGKSTRAISRSSTSSTSW